MSNNLPALCPHCAKPLEVTWEVYRSWEVRFTKEGPALIPDEPVSFEGGECEACFQWVEPKDIYDPS